MAEGTPGALFVALEGGEGAGKTTLAAALKRRLEAGGHAVTLVREPGGTEAGELLRRVLQLRLTPWAEAFAFLAARAQVVAEVIRPALEAGQVVICDRFEGSTFAYQGHARGLDPEALRAANALATGGLSPDLTLFLDLDPATGESRKAGESGVVQTGTEALEFHRRVRDGYRAQAATAHGTWLTLDAARPAGAVLAEALAAIQSRLG